MKKILIIEDNQITALMLKQTLELHGYEVDVSPDVVDCFNRLASNMQYDLAIVDFWLGKYGNGDKVEKVLRKLHIKAVYYTGDTDVTSFEIPVVFKGQGADLLLVKIKEILGE